MLNDLRFMQALKGFTDSDKVELLKCFKLQKAMPGQRIYGASEKIDKFALVLKGKVSIWYPDKEMLKAANKTPGRICVCAETEIEAKRRRLL